MLINVKDHGAAGGGATLDQRAVQSCIDLCGEKGGGTVVFPPGTYLTGTLNMRSGVCLRLDWGAVVQAVDDVACYPALKPTPLSRPEADYALISALKCRSIRFEGSGTFRGNGDSPFQVAGKSPDAVSFRPAMFLLEECENVAFENIQILYSSFWNVHLKHCVDVTLRGLTIKTHKGRINADGIDPDGSRNVIISDCAVDTGDDALVFKSTEGKACENIAVSNCILSSSAQAIKFGTESWGPIRNITISNCIVRESNIALAMFLKDGGSIEDVLISNCVIEAAGIMPVIVDISRRYPDQTHAAGTIRNIAFNSLVINAPGRALIEGFDKGSLLNVRFSDIVWNIRGDASDFSRYKKPTSTRFSQTDENMPNYANLPWQFTCVNASGLVLRDIAIHDMRAGKMQDRGAVCLKNVQGAKIEHVRSSAPPKPLTAFHTEGCTHIEMSAIPA